jgi:lipoate-protein ligase A
MITRFAVSNSYDVYHNLALEEYALRHFMSQFALLLFWKSDSACVMGKFQNPYREIDLNYLDQHQISLARRMTGGGTVYHDRGNLNFSFITPLSLHQPEQNLNAVIEALKTFHLDARAGDKKDLFIGDKKISGSAFTVIRKGTIHHGTLLIDSDLAVLKQALNSPVKIIHDHSIPSRPSSVVNIGDLAPDIREEDLILRIIGSHPVFREAQLIDDLEDWVDPVELAEIENKYRSADWIYGFPEKFEIGLEKKIGDETVTLLMNVTGNRISGLRVNSDAENEKSCELIARLANQTDLMDLIREHNHGL